MKLLLNTIFTGLLLVCIASTGAANTLLGGDITYRWLSGNNYEVSLHVYEKCDGTTGITQAQLSLTAASVGYAYSKVLNLKGSSDLTSLCTNTSATTSCNGGTLFGAMDLVFKDTVTLPANYPDYVFSTTLCCRGGNTATLASANGKPLYLETTLNKSKVVKNNTPQFFNRPQLYIGTGQNLNLDLGAYDTDGDSLVYELVAVKEAAGTALTYATGYSVQEPASSATGIRFSNFTGQFNFTPNTSQIFALSVLVHEYRNGNHIGSVQREVNIKVDASAHNNAIPRLTGFNGNSDFVSSACTDETMQFFIKSTDPDANQQLSINTLSVPAGMNVSINTLSLRPEISVSWRTDSTMASAVPYKLYFSVSDNACPTKASQTFAYLIYLTNCHEDVLPGDVNGDNSANMFDLLPIGLAYGDTGTLRNNATTNWVYQDAYDWNTRYINGRNHKHADCDGNGVIDGNDLDAILQNYTAVGSYNNLIIGHNTGPILSLAPYYDTVTTGSVVNIPIILGSPTDEISDIYGAVFSINYNQKLIDQSTITVTFPNDGLMAGAKADSTIALHKDIVQFNRLDMGITRINRIGASGHGEIGVLSFVMQDDITGKDESMYATAEFNFAGIKVIDSRGNVIPVRSTSAHIVVKKVSTGIQDLFSQNLHLFPNPTRNFLNISSDKLVDQVNVYNTAGQIVYSNIYPAVNTIEPSIDVRELATGLYYVHITNHDGTMVYEKFVKIGQ